MLEISDEELDEKLKTGVPRIDNLITWSKVFLVREGLLDASHPNVWTLTEDGLKRQITDADVLKIFKKIQGAFAQKRGRRDSSKTVEEQELEVQWINLTRRHSWNFSDHWHRQALRDYVNVYYEHQVSQELSLEAAPGMVA